MATTTTIRTIEIIGTSKGKKFRNKFLGIKIGRRKEEEKEKAAVAVSMKETRMIVIGMEEQETVMR